MKKFINNIIAMVIALSISAVTAKAQDGMCNDFRTGVSSAYTRQMTKEELIYEYRHNTVAMNEMINVLKWHNTMRGWGFDSIDSSSVITAFQGGKIKKATGQMLVARNCNGKVQYYLRGPKTRFGGEDKLYITMRGEDIDLASMDCGNHLWDKHDIPNETPLAETDTATSKSGNASAVATATASVGDINITVPPAVTNNNYISSGGSNYGGGYGYSSGYGYGGYYGSSSCYGGGYNSCYGGGLRFGVAFGPFGIPIPYIGFNGGNCGNYSSCGTTNFTPSSYNEYNTYNYYGDDDDGDIVININNVNNNVNNNHDVLTFHTGTIEGKPGDGGPIDPPSGDDGNPIDPGSGDNGTTGDGTDPGSGNGPVDPGSGKTDETTVQTTEMFKGSFETKTLSVNTNEKVTGQQQLSGKKSFETGPSLTLNSKVNGNNEVFAKQTQLESYTKSFQTDVSNKFDNQTLRNLDTQSKTFTISNSGKQNQNVVLSKTALQKEQPRTLKEFSNAALQNKQVSNDQQNMSPAVKTASVRNDANQRNGQQQTFQSSMSARGNDVPQNQSFNRSNEVLQKGFNVNNVQNHRIDNGNNFQRNENFGLSKRTGNQYPAPQMNFNQQPQQRNFVSAPQMQRGGNMMMQQAPPMMRGGGNPGGSGLAKAGHR